MKQFVSNKYASAYTYEAIFCSFTAKNKKYKAKSLDKANDEAQY